MTGPNAMPLSGKKPDYFMTLLEVVSTCYLNTNLGKTASGSAGAHAIAELCGNSGIVNHFTTGEMIRNDKEHV